MFQFETKLTFVGQQTWKEKEGTGTVQLKNGKVNFTRNLECLPLPNAA